MTAHIYFVDSKGRFLLQKRSMKKSESGGKRQVSVSGHVNFGEAPIAAAVREAEEETGIQLIFSKLKRISKINGIKRSYDLKEGKNNEFTTVYFYPVSDEELENIRKNYNLHEIEEFTLIPISDFETLIWEYPEMFSRSLHHLATQGKPILNKIKNILRRRSEARSRRVSLKKVFPEEIAFQAEKTRLPFLLRKRHEAQYSTHGAYAYDLLVDGKKAVPILQSKVLREENVPNVMGEIDREGNLAIENMDLGEQTGQGMAFPILNWLAWVAKQKKAPIVLKNTANPGLLRVFERISNFKFTPSFLSQSLFAAALAGDRDVQRNSRIYLSDDPQAIAVFEPGERRAADPPREGLSFFEQAGHQEMEQGYFFKGIQGGGPYKEIGVDFQDRREWDKSPLVIREFNQVSSQGVQALPGLSLWHTEWDEIEFRDWHLWFQGKDLGRILAMGFQVSPRVLPAPVLQDGVPQNLVSLIPRSEVRRDPNKGGAFNRAGMEINANVFSSGVPRNTLRRSIPEPLSGLRVLQPFNPPSWWGEKTTNPRQIVTRKEKRLQSELATKGPQKILRQTLLQAGFLKSPSMFLRLFPAGWFQTFCVSPLNFYGGRLYDNLELVNINLINNQLSAVPIDGIRSEIRGEAPANEPSGMDIEAFQNRAKKIAKGSLIGLGILGVVYLAGGLEGYFAVIRSIPKDAYFYFPAALINMIFGFFNWGLTDAIGQYQSQGVWSRKSQSFILALAGIGQGFSAHILFNLPGNQQLPDLSALGFGIIPGHWVNFIFITGVVGIGGIMITAYHSTVLMLAKKWTGAPKSDVKEDVKKAAILNLFLFITAVLKTGGVVALDKVYRYLADAVYDFAKYSVAGTVMNFVGSPFTRKNLDRIKSWASNRSSPRSEIRSIHDFQGRKISEQQMRAWRDEILKALARKSSAWPVLMDGEIFSLRYQPLEQAFDAIRSGTPFEKSGLQTYFQNTSSLQVGDVVLTGYDYKKLPKHWSDGSPDNYLVTSKGVPSSYRVGIVGKEWIWGNKSPTKSGAWRSIRASDSRDQRILSTLQGDPEDPWFPLAAGQGQDVYVLRSNGQNVFQRFLPSRSEVRGQKAEQRVGQLLHDLFAGRGIAQRLTSEIKDLFEEAPYPIAKILLERMDSELQDVFYQILFEKIDRFWPTLLKALIEQAMTNPKGETRLQLLQDIARKHPEAVVADFLRQIREKSIRIQFILLLKRLDLNHLEDHPLLKLAVTHLIVQALSASTIEQQAAREVLVAVSAVHSELIVGEIAAVLEIKKFQKPALKLMFEIAKTSGENREIVEKSLNEVSADVLTDVAQQVQSWRAMQGPKPAAPLLPFHKALKQFEKAIPKSISSQPPWIVKVVGHRMLQRVVLETIFSKAPFETSAFYTDIQSTSHAFEKFLHLSNTGRLDFILGSFLWGEASASLAAALCLEIKKAVNDSKPLRNLEYEGDWALVLPRIIYLANERISEASMERRIEALSDLIQEPIPVEWNPLFELATSRLYTSFAPKGRARSMSKGYRRLCTFGDVLITEWMKRVLAKDFSESHTTFALMTQAGVSNETMDRIFKETGLADVLYPPTKEEIAGSTGTIHKHADMFESLAAAFYLAGGWEKMDQFLRAAYAKGLNADHSPTFDREKLISTLRTLMPLPTLSAQPQAAPGEGQTIEINAGRSEMRTENGITRRAALQNLATFFGGAALPETTLAAAEAKLTAEQILAIGQMAQTVQVWEAQGYRPLRSGVSIADFGRTFKRVSAIDRKQFPELQNLWSAVDGIQSKLTAAVSGPSNKILPGARYGILLAMDPQADMDLWDYASRVYWRFTVSEHMYEMPDEKSLYELAQKGQGRKSIEEAVLRVAQDKCDRYREYWIREFQKAGINEPIGDEVQTQLEARMTGWRTWLQDPSMPYKEWDESQDPIFNLVRQRIRTEFQKHQTVIQEKIRKEFGPDTEFKDIFTPDRPDNLVSAIHDYENESRRKSAENRIRRMLESLKQKGASEDAIQDAREKLNKLKPEEIRDLDSEKFMGTYTLEAARSLAKTLSEWSRNGAVKVRIYFDLDGALYGIMWTQNKKMSGVSSQQINWLDKEWPSSKRFPGKHLNVEIPAKTNAGTIQAFFQARTWQMKGDPLATDLTVKWPSPARLVRSEIRTDLNSALPLAPGITNASRNEASQVLTERKPDLDFVNSVIEDLRAYAANFLEDPNLTVEGLLQRHIEALHSPAAHSLAKAIFYLRQLRQGDHLDLLAMDLARRFTHQGDLRELNYKMIDAELEFATSHMKKSYGNHPNWYEENWIWAVGLAVAGGEHSLNQLWQELQKVGQEIFMPDIKWTANYHWSAAYQEVLIEAIYLATTYGEKDAALKKEILGEARTLPSSYASKMAEFFLSKGNFIHPSRAMIRDFKLANFYRVQRAQSPNYTAAVLTDKKPLLATQNPIPLRSEIRMGFKQVLANTWVRAALYGVVLLLIPVGKIENTYLQGALVGWIPAVMAMSLSALPSEFGLSLGQAAKRLRRPYKFPRPVYFQEALRQIEASCRAAYPQSEPYVLVVTGRLWGVGKSTLSKKIQEH